MRKNTILGDKLWSRSQIMTRPDVSAINAKGWNILSREVYATLHIGLRCKVYELIGRQGVSEAYGWHIKEGE